MSKNKSKNNKIILALLSLSLLTGTSFSQAADVKTGDANSNAVTTNNSVSSSNGGFIENGLPAGYVYTAKTNDATANTPKTTAKELIYGKANKDDNNASTSSVIVKTTTQAKDGSSQEENSEQEEIRVTQNEINAIFSQMKEEFNVGSLDKKTIKAEAQKIKFGNMTFFLPKDMKKEKTGSGKDKLLYIGRDKLSRLSYRTIDSTKNETLDNLAKQEIADILSSHSTIVNSTYVTKNDHKYLEIEGVTVDNDKFFSYILTNADKVYHLIYIYAPKIQDDTTDLKNILRSFDTSFKK